MHIVPLFLNCGLLPVSQAFNLLEPIIFVVFILDISIYLLIIFCPLAALFSLKKTNHYHVPTSLFTSQLAVVLYVTQEEMKWL